MLKQASISQIRSGEISRKLGYVVACMAFYPRGLKKELLDEYRAHLAPDRQLFSEWKEVEQKSGHDEAFFQTKYEERFTLAPDARESLRRLVDISKTRDVYLACQCEPGERCHREMLLLYAQSQFKAEIEPPHHSYPVFQKRIDSLKK